MTIPSQRESLKTLKTYGTSLKQNLRQICPSQFVIDLRWTLQGKIPSQKFGH